LKRLACVLLLALVSACGTAPKKTPPATSGKYYSDDGPPDRIPDNLADIPNAVPRNEPFHRYANRPYTVFGRTYVPVVNRDPTRERGIASWYGRKFHGLKTSSGEPYDMFAMTAAHPTLPIPSYARVTNLKTGEWVVVRINDRGPFHSNRVIDLSYAAAARIGIAGPGSGLVEVERIFESPEPEAVVSQTLPEPQRAVVETPLVIEEPAGLWLQLGAFSSRESAENFRDKVAREMSWLFEPVQVTAREGLHRVRLGPYRNREEALAIADKVRQTLGFVPTLITR
jgi:rare lipoprotein A